MRENREASIKSKKKDLDPKYLLCDPLPDPSNEKDLTTFITLWTQMKDKTLKECADQCQISENVIRSMQNILGEALANYNNEKVEWCYNYMAQMREIVLQKFDSISAHTLEYIENHIKIPPEEMEKMKNTIGGRKNESNIRQEFFLVQSTPDFRLGIYGNVAGKAQLHKYVEFGGVSCKTPRQYGSQQLIIRAIWTSYDDVTIRTGTYYPDIVVGGVVDFRLYQYPEGPRQAMKWTVRNVYSIEDRLRNIPYPDPSSQLASPDPISIQFLLPEYVFVSENDDIRVGVWDEKEKVWSTAEIDDLQLDKSSRKLEFVTRKLSQMAFLQSRCTDYPYKRWKLRCTENQKAVLDIETRRGLNLSFEIGPEYLMLLQDTEAGAEDPFPELRHLQN
jgi:cancer susceptibility candidate protein 1